MPETIYEIEKVGSERATELVRDWYTTLDEIKASRVEISGPHADLLTEEQRLQAAADAKAQKAAQKAQEYRSDYEELTQGRNDAVRSRTRKLHKELMTVESTSALAEARKGDVGALLDMVDMAAHAGNPEFARAAFSVAAKRQLGDVVAAYFDKVAPEARDLYAEYSQAPTEETLENRLADAARIFAAPDPRSLIPVAAVY